MKKMLTVAQMMMKMTMMCKHLAWSIDHLLNLYASFEGIDPCRSWPKGPKSIYGIIHSMHA